MHHRSITAPLALIAIVSVAGVAVAADTGPVNPGAPAPTSGSDGVAGEAPVEFSALVWNEEFQLRREPGEPDDGAGGEGLTSLVPSCSPHPPIEIQGDDGFLAPGSGVVAGTGTATDPYVIAGWCIDGDTWEGTEFDAGTGIEIEDTTRHFVVRDNIVRNFRGGSDAGAGVRVHDVAPGTGTVRGNRLANDDIGIAVSEANRTTLSENRIGPGGGIGVSVEDSPRSALVQNVVRGMDKDGVSVARSDSVRLENNTASENDLDGIHLQRSSRARLVDNAVGANEGDGIHLTDLGDAEVHGNNFQGNTVGLRASSVGGEIDATRNWWNATSGPSGDVTDACTGATAQGTGDPIEAPDDTVCFHGWLDAPNPDAGADDAR